MFQLIVSLMPLNCSICLIGPEPMDISTSVTSQSCQIPNSEVIILEGHTSEV